MQIALPGTLFAGRTLCLPTEATLWLSYSMPMPCAALQSHMHVHPCLLGRLQVPFSLLTECREHLQQQQQQEPTFAAHGRMLCGLLCINAAARSFPNYRHCSGIIFRNMTFCSCCQMVQDSISDVSKPWCLRQLGSSSSSRPLEAVEHHPHCIC